MMSVTVVCYLCYRNGASECGVFIAAHRLLEMAEAHDEMDMYDAVVQIRTTRPQFIDNMASCKLFKIKKIQKKFKKFISILQWIRIILKF